MDGGHKLVTIGDPGVGKTTLLHRLARKYFDPGVALTMHSGPLSLRWVPPSSSSNKSEETKATGGGERVITFDLWDTCGQERYQSLHRLYFRDAEVAVFAYSIDSMNSFQNLKDTWLRDSSYGGISQLSAHCVVVILALQSDLEETRSAAEEEAGGGGGGATFGRQVPRSLGEDLARALSRDTQGRSLFYEVSSKTGDGINEFLQGVVDHLSLTVTRGNRSLTIDDGDTTAASKRDWLERNRRTSGFEYFEMMMKSSDDTLLSGSHGSIGGKGGTKLPTPCRVCERREPHHGSNMGGGGETQPAKNNTTLKDWCTLM